jgi:hypothetical protein
LCHIRVFVALVRAKGVDRADPKATALTKPSGEKAKLGSIPFV